MSALDGELLNLVFHALESGIIVLDGDHRVVTWNDWVARASRLDPKSAVGRPLEELFAGARSARLVGALTAARDSGVSSLLTHSLHPKLFPLKTAAGFELIHDVTVRPLGPRTGRLCLLQIVNVTVASRRETVLRERHDARYKAVVEGAAKLEAMEAQLRQSQKMEAVGQLTGGIAHDFNNLLQGIVGSIDRVQQRIASGRLTDVDRFLEGAMSSANRAAALTHRLLAFSRRQPVDPKPVNVNELVASVEDLLRRSMGESIALKMNPASDLWLIRCDPNQLENALLNLVINARDAMPDGGTVTIETVKVTLDAKDALVHEVVPGDYVLLKVADTGVGMPTDVRERAFDPFFTTKPLGQGTGLGLSMIYGFVRQSQGSIRIFSEPNKGTMIEIRMPRFIGEVSISAVEAPSRENRVEGGEVVLVVEDEALVRQLAVETLRELGYLPMEASDSAAALSILQSSQRIDLLITDIGLPGINGRQLADAGRGIRPGMKVLFMTGYAEKAASGDFLTGGMEIIVKPFAMDAFARRVGQMLRR